MKILLVFSLFLVSVGESRTVRGYPGGGVLITCKYDTKNTSTPKYLCKGPSPNCTDQIRTGDNYRTNEWITEGRFSLFHNTNTSKIRVVIRDLTVEDSGWYQCGGGRNGQRDVYTAVELTVKEDQDYQKIISVTDHVGGGVTISCKYPQSLRSDSRFLCRTVNTTDCHYRISDKESRKEKNDRRFSLHDHGNQTFTVVINNLTEGDSGEYWCGAEVNWTSGVGYKVYTTQVKLRVADFPPPDSPPPGFPTSSVITGVSVILVLLLIGLFILTLRKRRKAQGTTTHRNILIHTVPLAVSDCEEVKDTKGLPTSDAGGSSVCSTAQLPTNISEPSQTVHDNVQIPSSSSDFSVPVYSTVQVPSNPPNQDTCSATQSPTNPSDSSVSVAQCSAGKPAEDLTYATVKFSKKAGRSTDAVGPNMEEDSCVYATLRMKVLLVFSLFLVSVGGGESRTVRGYPGGGVLIRCRYERRYTSNKKYLCKGAWPNCPYEIMKEVKNEWRSTGRFSLLDNTRAAEFWVMIRDLTVQDSGLYQCGIDKAFIDVYTPVELTVEEDLSYEKNISVIGHVGGGVNISCKYPQSLSSDPKFLCRRVNTTDCNYVTSVKESRRNEGRFFLHDDRNQTFTVVINNLTEGDSGEYWCGAESDWTSDNGYKLYITQVNLSVTGDSLTPGPTTPTTSKTTSSSARDFPVTIVITIVSVILVLLLIGLLFFILVLRKRSRPKGLNSIRSQSLTDSIRRHRATSTVYEEVNDGKHLPASDPGDSSVYSNAEPPTDISEPSQTVYDNVPLHSSSSDMSNPVYSPTELPSDPPDQDIYSTPQLPTIPSDSSVSAPQRSAKKIYLADSSTDAVAFNEENGSCDYD
ncbi:hypothetical protein NFI96_025373 [Prochilodus magdalenae]|nr:hypothetical protein NFI96_025373 [Prochilodus magdalenae]